MFIVWIGVSDHRYIFIICYYLNFRCGSSERRVWSDGTQWQRYCCIVWWTHLGMSAASRKQKDLCPLLSLGSYHCFTFRVGATRSAQDLRDHGHKTLWFSTTPISSKISFSPSYLGFFMLGLDRGWVRSSWWLVKQRDTKRRERRTSSTTNRQGSSRGSSVSSPRWEICSSKLYYNSSISWFL